MTCVAATTFGIASDRLVTGGHDVQKVYRNATLVVGTAGWAAGIVAVGKAVRRGATLEEVAEAVRREKVEGLALRAGVIYYIDEGGEFWPVKQKIWAIGSGGDTAYGYLSAVRKPKPNDLRRAVRIASKRNDDCGRRVDLRLAYGCRLR